MNSGRAWTLFVLSMVVVTAVWVVGAQGLVTTQGAETDPGQCEAVELTQTIEASAKVRIIHVRHNLKVSVYYLVTVLKFVISIPQRTLCCHCQGKPCK
jgi:hypothetical protein